MKLTPRLALVFILYATTLLLMAGVLAYSTGREALRSATISELSATSIEKQSALNDWMEEKRADIAALSSDPAIITEASALFHASSGSPEANAARERLLQEFQTRVRTGEFLSVMLIDAQTGKVIAATDPDEQGTDQKDSAFFLNGNKSTFLENIHYSQALQGPTMIASAPLGTEDGQLLGIIAGRLDLDEVNAIINRRSGLRRTDDAFLVNTSHIIVTQPYLVPDPAVLKMEVHTVAVNRCLTQTTGSVEAHDYRGVPAIIAYRWIPERELCLIVKMDQAEAYGPVQAFGKTVFAISVLALFVAAGLAITLSRSLTHPVLALQEGVARFGQGHLDIRLPDTRADELGSLAHEFNQMATALSEKESQLRMYAQTLEQKVQARTKDLQEAHSQLLRAEEIGKIGSWVWSIPEDRIIPSEGLYKLLGLTAQDFGNTFDAFFKQVHPDDVERMQQTVQSVLQTSGSFELETRIIRRDGQIRTLYARGESLLDEHGNPSRLLGVAVDITERNQAEEGLRRFELLSNHSRDIILFMRQEDGCILEANAAALQAYGYGRDELLGLTIRDLHAPNTLGLTAKQMAQADAGGILFEAVHRRKDGSTFPVEVSSRGATIGNMHTRVSVVRDITERKQAEEALRADEERYRAIFDNALDAIVVTNPSGGGAVLSANPAACRLFGYSAEEFRGLSREAMIDSTSPNLPVLWEQRQHSGKAATELIYKCKDGAHFPGEITSTFYQDKNGERRAVAIIRDITERKEAEEKVRRSETMLRAILEQMPSGVTVRDARTGELLLSNVRSREILNTLVDTPAHFEQYRGFHPDGSLYRNEEWPLSRSIATGEVVRAEEMNCQRSDETWITLNINSAPVRDRQGQIVMGVAIFDDITERKQAERQLRYQAALLSNVNDAIVASDSQFRITVWNAGAASLYGWKAEEVIGRNGLEIVRTEWPEKDAAEMRRMIAETGRWRGEATQTRKDGTRFPVEVSSLVLRDDSGQITGYISVNRDITTRKQAEETLHRLTEDLGRSNAELEQFAYVASHDLQEPLRMVSSYLQLLARRYQGKLDRDADEFIAYAVDGAKRMQNLINDLLAFSRVGTQGRPLGLSSCEKILAEALMNLQVAIEESDATVTHDPLPTVFCDQPQLVQVFQNLIGNSIKFRGPQAPRIHISARQDESEWIFSFRDNGIGFDVKFSERIFEIFQRLHSRTAYPGTGIGLAICKRIVQRHSGRIWVESNPGEGTTFYFALPIKEAS